MISRGFGSSLVIHYHLHPEKVEISIFIAININFLHTQLKLNCRFVEQTKSSVAFDFTACAHFQSFCLFIYFCVMQHLSNVFDILLPSEEEACRFLLLFFFMLLGLVLCFFCRTATGVKKPPFQSNKHISSKRRIHFIHLLF